jgi:tetratricopeptide (TPR) repeat protein
MKKAVLTFVLGACFGASVFAQNVDDAYKKGRELYNKKQYTSAVTSLDEVLKADQQNVMALFYRGVSHYYLKNYEQSIADLDKAIELYPIRADFYYYRSLARKEMKDLSMAYSDLSNAIALDEKQAVYFYERANIGLELGKGNFAVEKAETEQVEVTNAQVIMDADKASTLNGNQYTAFAKETRTALRGKLSDNEVALLPLTATSKPAPDDQKTIDIKKYITEHKFTSVEEGKQYYQELFATALPTGKKPLILGLLRNKVMKDVYGDALYQEDLDAMNQLLTRETWLLPEGRNYYFNVMQNSRYAFSGGVQRGKVYYFYKVNKPKNSDKYRILMYGVYNNESNLVYDSYLTYKEDSVNKTIQVFASLKDGYRWNVNTDNYVQYEVPKTATTSQAKFSTKGVLVEMANDNKHGLTKEKYNKAVKPAEASAVAEMKATLNYVILEYVKLLNKPSWWTI